MQEQTKKMQDLLIRLGEEPNPAINPDVLALLAISAFNVRFPQTPISRQERPDRPRAVLCSAEQRIKLVDIECKESHKFAAAVHSLISEILDEKGA